MNEKTELAWPVEAPFVVIRNVVDEDLDEFQHVNNVRYIEWTQDVAWAHSEALGFSFADYERLGVGCVVWRHTFDYVSPLHAGEDVAVATWIKENDARVRMRRAFEMRRVSNGAICFRGETLFVTIEMASGKPCRMPQAFIDAYRPAV
ncbi:MAG: thioesterase family protein [Pseudomonadota bacterium]